MKIHAFTIFLVAIICYTAKPIADTPHIKENADKPNIVMVLMDDLGYTDLGSYGGDYDTVNIDLLAKENIVFTNAHVSPICAPTRAYLMTGKDPHAVGLGSQNGVAPPGVSVSTPGYKGSLEGEFQGLAHVLKHAGYNTFQVGKWHLGSEEYQTPQALGFDENFTLLDGAASHYSDMNTISLSVSETGKADYNRNEKKIKELPDNFYSTKNYTDEIIGMIERNRHDSKPFFAYLAYTAPHDPLHAPQDLINKYYEQYKKGYIDLRNERILRLAKMGIITEVPLVRWIGQTPSWNELSNLERKDMQMRMAVYAAMIEYIDIQIGKLVTYLKSINQYDNTLIVIMSDNGAAPVPRTWYTAQNVTDLAWQEQTYPLHKIEDYGKQGSFTTLGMPNAQAASGPFFGFKTNLYEGGTRVPMIVKVPNSEQQFMSDTFIHIADLYPTFAEYAGADISGQDGLVGSSAKKYFERKSNSIGDNEFGIAFMGWRAYRKGDWKLVFVSEKFGGTGEYALYNLASDPGEVNNLAARYPEKVNELSRKWNQFASDQKIKVVPMEEVNRFWNPLADRLLGINWAEQ